MNLVIIFVVSIFMFLVLLNELSESDGFDLGGVPSKILSEHMGSSFPNGFYTHYSEKLATIWTWAYALTVLGFVWVSINIVDLFQLAVVYAVLGTFTVAIGFAEIIAPKKTFSTALTGWVGKNVSVGALILMGLGISAVFVPLNYVMGFGVSVEPLLINNSPWMSLILMGLAIPFLEEAAFGASVGASAIETVGIIAGIVLIMFSWVAFHYLAWAPLTVNNIIFLALFRVFALVPLIKFKSTLPGMIGHVGVNISAVLISMGVFTV